ncbi:MAG: outer membrane protein assembly factor BamB family protein [Planctomycetota bacterium]|jgi:outer membrane protein assembly factor BamB
MSRFSSCLPRGRDLLAALLLSVLAGAVPALCAEEEEEEFDPRVYLETEEDASGILRAAWRARSADPPNWRLAIEKYLQCAREYGHTVYAQTDRLYLPMRVLIRRELASLPKEGRDLYAVLKSREAELAYRRALGAGAWHDLEKVAAHYPCLAPAPRSLFVLGERARATGDAGRSVYYWQRLITEYPDWGEAGLPSVLTRSALVAAEAGRRGEARRLLGTLQKTSGLVRLRVAGREVLAVDEIKRRLGGPGIAGHVAEADTGYWPSIGGSPAHDRSVERMVDAGVRRWKRDLGGKPSSRSRVPSHIQRARAQMPAPLPRRHAVCAGGMVFLAGDSDVIAVRAMSEHVIWPASKNSQANAKLPCSRMTLPAIGDGKLYAVLGSPQRINPYNWRNRGGDFSSQVTMRAYALVGGKLKWETGRKDDAETRKFLRSVDLVAAPVYAGGYVYCPAIKRSSISDAYMLCFDATDGRLVWKTFVCAGHPIRAGYHYSSYGVTEDTLPPAVSQGLLAFATNLGAVGVMDSGSGDLLWIYLYDRVEALTANNRFGRPATTKVDSWAASAPIIHEGIVYAAPQDSPELLALDLATGKVRWKSRRGKLKYLVGVHKDWLICSGGGEVVAFSARSGKRMWRGPMSGGDAGQGLVGDGCALIPSSRGIQRFDLKTGKIVASYRFREAGGEEGGNLVITKGTAGSRVLICVGKSTVGGYFDWQETVDRLQKQIATKPEEASPRAEMGEIHFSAEKYRQAADFFKASLQRIKPGERTGGILLEPVVRRQIWESHSRLARALEKKGEFAEALKDYAEAHKYAQDEIEKMTGHMRFARCREGLKEWAVAVAQYQQVIYTPKLLDTGGGRSRYYGETYRTPEGQKVMAGHFAKAQIDRLIRKHTPEVYAALEAEAAEHLRTAGEERSVGKAEEVVRWYPNSGAVSPALILLSQLLTDAGKHADAAARLREHLWKRPDSERALEARARLALSYKRQNMVPLARSMMRQMARRWSAKSFKLDEKDWTVDAFVKANMPAEQLTGGGASVELGGPMKTGWRYSRGSTMLIPKAGPHELAGAIFVRSGSEVSAVDLATGKLLWRQSGLSPFRNMRNSVDAVAGAALVAVIGDNKLVGLAPATGQRLWETEIVEKGAANMRVYYGNRCQLALGEGVVAVGPYTTKRDPRTGRTTVQSKLLVLDQATGNAVWSQDKIQGTLCSLRIREGTLFTTVYDMQKRRTKLVAYEVADGAKRFSADLAAGNFRDMELHVQGDRLLAVARNTVYCFDVITGKLKWRNTAGQGASYLVAVDDRRVVATAYSYSGRKQTTSVFAWELDSGKKLWETSKISGAFQNPLYLFQNMGRPHRVAGSTDHVVVATRDYRARKGLVAGFDGKNGKLLWRADLPRNVYGGIVLIGSRQAATVVSGTGRAERRIWDLKTGKLVERSGVNGSGGFVTVQEGAVIEVTDRGVTRLSPKSAPGGQKPEGQKQ